MRFDLNVIKEITESCVENGVGLISNKSFNYKNYTVTYYKIYTDSFIGMHKAKNEFIYVINGNGYIFYDGIKDSLYKDVIYFVEEGKELSITSLDEDELDLLIIKGLK